MTEPETKVIEFEWETIVERLKHHRERLSITKEEMKDYIKQKYGKTFWRLTDDEILELGKTLSKCKDKYDILF